MEKCRNCFLDIEDLRKETRCDKCKRPLHKSCAIKTDGMTLCDACLVTRAEDKPEVKLPETIRRSYIDVYKACPYKFKLEVLDGHEQLPTIYTQLGIDVHEIIELLWKNEINYIEALQQYEERFHKYEEPLFDGMYGATTKEDMFNKGVTCIENFYQNIKPELPQPIMTEERLFFDIGDGLPQVSIAMDGVIEVDDELEIVDWKTGKVMVGQKISNDLQAPLYIHAVQTHFQRSVRKFTFYYLAENKVRVFERSEHNPDLYYCTVGKKQYHMSVLDGLRDVNTLFSKIKNGQFSIPARTKGMYYTCKMCHLAKQNLCRGAYEEGWFQATGKEGGNTWGF